MSKNVDVTNAASIERPTSPQPTDVTSRADSRLRRFVLALFCGVCLIVFYILSLTAVQTKSPTIDELPHAISGYTQAWMHDFRLAPEVPPAWQYIASVPLAFNPPDFKQDDDWEALLSQPSRQGAWIYQVAYNTPPNDADAIVNRCRAAVVVFGVMLGALLAWWTWELGGALAAIVAILLFVLDPNFLGHAAIVKNDVAFAFCWLAVSYLTWKVGRRATIGTVVLLGLATGLAIGTKTTGLLALPLILLLLLIRASAWPAWQVGRRQLSAWPERVLACGLIYASVTILSVGFIWSIYGFRYSMTSEPGATMPLESFFQSAQTTGTSDTPREHLPDRSTFESWRNSKTTRVAMWLSEHRLLPDAFIRGFLRTSTTTTGRPAFLLGTHYEGSRAAYFPVAMAVKTPLATIGLLLFASASLCLARIRSKVAVRLSFRGWAFVCLIVPATGYFVIAMNAGVNIGLRHIFPVYAPLFCIAGLTVAALTAGRPKAIVIGTFILVIGLLGIESLSSYPDFLAFFNQAAGGSRGGRAILADSNLDWGQDIKPLARWRASHPKGELYLSCWANADPAYYGIDYTAVTGNSVYGPTPVSLSEMREPGYLAVSAYNLELLRVADPQTGQSLPLSSFEPHAVIGQTIYVFRYQMP